MTNKYVSNYSEDSIGKYFKDVRKSELLTPEEEVILAERIQKGDEKAIDELCEANLKFVISVAKEYQGQGLGLSDLISEGNYGLVKAALRFDHTRGFRFISYAVWWIRQSIIQSLNDNSRTIRLPANVILKLAKIKKELDKFEFENEREASTGDVIGYDGDEPLSIIETPTVGSLNKPINEDGSELGDLISSDINDEGYDKYDIDNNIKDELDSVLSKLSDRERDIIECYFGINKDHAGMTLDDIGEGYGLTKERIRQIKEKAIRKLRHNGGKLFDLLNE